MLHQFLNHYLNVVGVPPAHVHLLIDSRSLVSDEARASMTLALARNNVSSSAMTSVPMHNVTARGGFDRLKLAATNNVLRNLPTAAWAIVADLDEFLWEFHAEMSQNHENSRDFDEIKERIE